MASLRRAFLTKDKDRILFGQEPIHLKGVNLGGWLMMEGYLLASPNRPVHEFKQRMLRRYGRDGLREFEELFRFHFIQRADFQRIARWGCNCVRLPFHYRQVEDRPFHYGGSGLSFLDQAIRWARSFGLWVILDLHAAPGCQNHDWHADSAGQARLWTSRSFQHRTVALWEFLADRYKGEPQVAGYDILNEAVVADDALLNDLYRRVVRAIRTVDPHHLIFLEGNRWATDMACLTPQDNTCLSLHAYEPLDFTFNFVPGLRYTRSKHAGRSGTGKARMRKRFRPVSRIAKQWPGPVLVGEFGVNGRDGHYGEEDWVDDMCAVFAECGCHWTYWTYKSVRNNVFPDGLMQYLDNPAWVNRQGPVYGWDNIPHLWAKEKAQIVRSWQSKNFHPNESILKILRKYWGQK